jgi:hypothetical protein
MSNFLAPTLVLGVFIVLAIATRAFRMAGVHLRHEERRRSSRNLTKQAKCAAGDGEADGRRPSLTEESDFTSGVYQSGGSELRSFTTSGLHRQNAKKLQAVEKALSGITAKLDALQRPASGANGAVTFGTDSLAA